MKSPILVSLKNNDFINMFNLPAGRKLLDGKYTINKLLDSGGLGVTYLVEDSSKNIFVLKTIQEKFKLNEEIRDYFYQEAGKLSECKGHPNIVKIIRLFTEDIEEVGVNGWPFIIMEYVEGITLRNLINYNDKPLKEEEAIRYIQQIGRALSEVIHAGGNIHRDVKPSNIVIRNKNSEAVLIDFGLTRKFSIHDTSTHTGISSGSFCAIEQNIPQQYKDIVRRYPCSMDVYSLAATMYFMLTKKNPPLARNRQNEVRQNNRDPLTPPKELNPEISDTVNTAILEGMSIEPDNRIKKVDTFLGLLDSKLNNNIETTKKIPSPTPSIKQEVDTNFSKKKAKLKDSTPTVPAFKHNGSSPKRRNFWLAIPASVVLGLGAFWIVPKSPSLNATYESEQHGFSFKYPKSWNEGKIESSLGAASDIVAEFIIPTDNPKEDDAKFVASVEPLNSFNVSLDNYVDDIKQQLNNDNAKQIVREVEILPASRKNFKQVNYIMEENGQQVERTELIGIDDGKAYTLAYEAETEYFKRLNNTMLRVFDSFAVID